MNVLQVVVDEGVAENTYFMYTSDHGFQLGEFNILIDKRHMYDHDIRIHMLFKGPGIAPGSTFDFLGTQVDLAVTWLGMAGLDRPASMDGRSVVPLLVDASKAGVPAATKKHIARVAPGGEDAYKSAWRDSVFIEYYFNSGNAKCGGYITEDTSNNFIGLRHMAGNPLGDTSYAEYQTGNQGLGDGIEFDKVDFIEYFNLTQDNWQMMNLHKTAPNATLQLLHTKLHKWFQCKGDSCP
jgi:N-acetylglucosamine-6-sulfatase